MFKIVKDTNQSIREKCSDVDLPPSKDDIKLLKNMINYLKLSQDEKYAEKHNIRPGVGLAAPQIGINRKMIAIYYELDEKNTILLDFEGEQSDFKLNNDEALFIGPEGGFSAQERARFKRKISLQTPLILRSQTAIIACATKILL